jgi:hypothetical protein
MEDSNIQEWPGSPENSFRFDCTEKKEQFEKEEYLTLVIQDKVYRIPFSDLFTFVFNLSR